MLLLGAECGTEECPERDEYSVLSGVFVDAAKE
jgi:hypothetical protein